MTEEDIRHKITHILKIYPALSPTMLQAALGPKVPPAIWRPVLAKMAEEGEIDLSYLVAESPSGQHRTYTRITLEGTLNCALSK